MARRPILLALATALVSCGQPTTAVDDAPTAPVDPTAHWVEIPASLEHQVDTYISAYGRNWPSFQFHGVVLVAQGESAVMRRSYGMADLAAQRKQDAEAAFPLGTLSAQLTAATVLRLADAGVVGLDATVDQFVPEFERGDEIRVEHLLAHTAGISTFTDAPWFAYFKTRAPTTSEIVKTFSTTGLEFDPGTDFAASDSNYALLGAIIESATGKDYDRVVRELVLQPAGMTRTTFGSSAPDRPIGLRFDEGEFLKPISGVDPRAFGAAGGWAASADDLLRFVSALGNGTLLSPVSRRRMFGDNDAGLPLAWTQSTLADRAAYAWPGHIDGFNAAALHVPHDGLTVIVLANTEVVHAGNVAFDVAKMVYGIETPRRTEPRPVPVEAEALATWAGTYALTQKTIDELVAVSDPQVLAILSQIELVGDERGLVLDVPVHGRKRMHPLSDRRFFFKDGPQSTARVVAGNGSRPDRLLLRRGDLELRYVRVDPRAPGQTGA